MDNGQGIGNMSQTFNKTTLGMFGQGKWIGEETHLLKGQIPQFYSAVCMSEVKVFCIHIEDFVNRFPGDIKTCLEEKVYPKLYKYRDILQEHNQIKHRVEEMDLGSANLAE